MKVCSVTDAHCSSLNIEILNMKLQLENETCLDFHLSLFYSVFGLKTRKICKNHMFCTEMLKEKWKNQ